MYMALKKAKIQAVYEGQTYEIFSGFDFPNESYERCGNGKGDYKNRGTKKILNIKYTPDFIGQGFICLLYTSPSPRDRQKSRMPSSA